MEFVPLCGAREEWLVSACVGLLHYSTGFFFLPWASLDNVLPLQTSSHRSVHRNDAVMERTGEKNYNAIKSYHKFQISITSNPIHNFTASIKWVICSGLRRLLERFTSF